MVSGRKKKVMLLDGKRFLFCKICRFIKINEKDKKRKRDKKEGKEGKRKGSGGRDKKKPGQREESRNDGKIFEFFHSSVGKKSYAF